MSPPSHESHRRAGSAELVQVAADPDKARVEPITVVSEPEKINAFDELEEVDDEQEKDYEESRQGRRK